MALHEALKWCHANRATIKFTPDSVCVSTEKAAVSARTVEEAVTLLSGGGAIRETVHEAAKRGFAGG